MLDIGWTELLVIGIVALIVVGPKDLPIMMRKLGQITGKMRSMARDFQRAMDDAADQAGVKDVARDIRNATSAKSMGLDGVDDAVRDLKNWDPSKPPTAAKPAKGAWPDDPAAPDAKPAKGPETAQLAARQAAARAERAEARKAAAAPPLEPNPDTTPEAPTGKGDA